MMQLVKRVAIVVAVVAAVGQPTRDSGASQRPQNRRVPPAIHGGDKKKTAVTHQKVSLGPLPKKKAPSELSSSKDEVNGDSRRAGARKTKAPSKKRRVPPGAGRRTGDEKRTEEQKLKIREKAPKKTEPKAKPEEQQPPEREEELKFSKDEVRVKGKYIVRLCAESDRHAVTRFIEEKHADESDQDFRAIVHAHVKYAFPGLLLRNTTARAAKVLTKEYRKKKKGACDVHQVGVRRSHQDASAIAPAGAWWHLDRLNQAHLPLDGSAPSTATSASAPRATIIVIDSGLDTTHEQFTQGGRTVSNIASFQWEYFKLFPGVWEEYPYYGTDISNNDASGHGTAAASLAAGATLGLAPNADVYGIRVVSAYGYTSSDYIVQGLDAVTELVVKGAVDPSRLVVVASFGGACLDGSPEYCARGAPEAIAVNVLRESFNVPVIVSAGNDGDDACFYLPAAAEAGVTVAASDYTDVIPEWSNYGKCVDAVAPGADIVAAASSLYGPDEDDLAYLDDYERVYQVASGTSLSAPLFAGAIAAVAMQNAKMTKDAETAVLAATSSGALFSDPSKCSSNAKLLQFPLPSFSSTYSHPSCPWPSDREDWPYGLEWQDDDYYDDDDDYADDDSDDDSDDNPYACEGDSGEDVTSCGAGLALYTLTLTDAYGDGWNGAQFCLQNEACLGCPSYSGTLETGDSSVRHVCIACNSTTLYEMRAGGGGWDAEVGWVLGEGYFTGGSGSASFLGCTALDMGPVYDDDTVFAACAPGADDAADVSYCLPGQTLYDLTLTDAFGDGWNGATYCLSNPDCLSGSADCPTYTGTLLDGNTTGDSLHVCIDCSLDSPYVMEAGNGGYDVEVHWQIGELTGRAGEKAFTCVELDEGSDDDDDVWIDPDYQFPNCANPFTSDAADVIACPAGFTLYDLTLKDTYGDGWNGATYCLSNEDCGDSCPTYSGTLLYGNSSGHSLHVCIDCSAGPYLMQAGQGGWDVEIRWSIGELTGRAGDKEFTCTQLDEGKDDDDDVWVPPVDTFPECETGDAVSAEGVTSCPAGLTRYDLTLTDSYGDGWNGATYCLSNPYCSTCPLYTGTLDYGNTTGDSLHVCIDCTAPGTYRMQAGAGGFDNEIHWSLGEIGGPAGDKTFTCYELDYGSDDDDDFYYDDFYYYGYDDYGYYGYYYDDFTIEPFPECADGDAVTAEGVTSCDAGYTLYTLTLTDAYGDGWNGATYCLQNPDCDTCVKYTGTLEYGISSMDTMHVCIDCSAPGEYSMQAGGGPFDVELSWQIGEFEARAGAKTFTCEELDSGSDDDDSYWDDEIYANYTFEQNLTLLALATCAGPSGEDVYSCPAGQTLYELKLMDEYGDGWNGAGFCLKNYECGADCPAYSGTLFDEHRDTRHVCIDCDAPGSYLMAAGGGYWDLEIVWRLGALTGEAGAIHFSGCDELGAPGTTYFDDVVDDDNPYHCAGETGEEAIEECPDGLTLYPLFLSDEYGDGWNGATFCLSSSTCDDCPSYSGTLEDGYESLRYVCIDCSSSPDQTYLLAAGGGAWDGEVSWTLGMLHGTGGYHYFYGCDDLDDVDDDPTVNDDVGHYCDYAPDGASTGLEPGEACPAGFTEYNLTLTDTFGDGWNGACFYLQNEGCGADCPSYAGTLFYGDHENRRVCVDCAASNGTYVFSAYGSYYYGYYDHEIRWELGELVGRATYGYPLTCDVLDTGADDDAYWADDDYDDDYDDDDDNPFAGLDFVKTKYGRRTAAAVLSAGGSALSAAESEKCRGVDVNADPRWYFDSFIFAADGAGVAEVAYNVEHAWTAPGYVSCNATDPSGGVATGKWCEGYAAASGAGPVTVADDAYQPADHSVSARACGTSSTELTFYAIHTLNFTADARTRGSPFFVVDATTAMPWNETVDFRAERTGRVMVAGECALAIGSSPWEQTVVAEASFDAPASRTFPITKGDYLSLSARASTYPGLAGKGVKCTLLLAPEAVPAPEPTPAPATAAPVKPFSPTPRPTPHPTPRPAASVAPTAATSATLSSTFTVNGIDLATAAQHTSVFAAAVAMLASGDAVDDDPVSQYAVSIQVRAVAGRRRLLSGTASDYVAVDYVVTLYAASQQSRALRALVAMQPHDVDDAIHAAAYSAGVGSTFADVFTVRVASRVDAAYSPMHAGPAPKPTAAPKSDSSSSSSSSSKKEASAGGAVVVAVLGVLVAVLAVAVGLLAFWQRKAAKQLKTARRGGFEDDDDGPAEIQMKDRNRYNPIRQEQVMPPAGAGALSDNLLSSGQI